MDTAFNLKAYDLTVPEVHHNLPPSLLYEHAIRYERDASIAHNGALVAYSGEKTGRSPKDKRIVCNPSLEPEHLVGTGEHPARRAQLPDQSPAGDDYLDTPRPLVLLRRLRRLGSRSIASRSA